MMCNFKTCLVKIIFLRFTCAAFLLVSCFNIFSQSHKTDSLKHAILSSSGNARADLLNKIGKEYWTTNRDSSLRYSGQALVLARSLGYKRAEAEAFRSMGMANKYDTATAKANFLQALPIFKMLGDKKGIADTYNNIGLMWMLSNYPAALNYFDSALVIFRQIDDKRGEGSVLNYINIVYQSMGDYATAVDYALQGLDVRKATNDDNGIIYSYINVAIVYAAGGQQHSAIKFYDQSIAYAIQHHIKPFQDSYQGLGKAYLALKQYDEARKYLLIDTAKRNHLLVGQLYLQTGSLDSAMSEFRMNTTLAQAWGNKSLLGSSMIGMGKVSFAKNNQQQALTYARQGYSLALEANDKNLLADAAAMLGFLYQKAGNYQQALMYSNQARNMLDSARNRTSESYQQKLAAFETKSEIEKREANLKILSAEKALQEQKLKSETLYRNIILFAALSVLLVAFFVIRNINGKRNEIQLQRDQIDLQRNKAEKALEDLKATQSQLIRQEKMVSLGELTAGIAHEIQNPLNFVNNFSELNQELIEEWQQETDKGNITNIKEIVLAIKENEEKINQHGKRAEAIVKGMLLHSRSNSGQKEPTNINALASEYLKLGFHGQKAKDNSFNTVFTTHFDESIGKIIIIPQDIGRVFLNLINNAIYAVNEKKKKNIPGYEPIISFSTKKLPGKVELKVVDNGLGIDKKILDKIFQPFFTTKPTGQGTGLGLSLSYDIIKAHGGELNVKTKENEGSEFIIELPLA